MRLAYLTNQYPHTAHTFIRREIAALEEQGWPVQRYSLRRTSAGVDEADRQERQRTTAVLDAGALGLLWAGLVVAASQPRAWLAALSTAWRAGWRSDRGLLVHLIYLLEACWLRRRLAREGVGHVHAHFGTNPAFVAMLCRRLGGPPFSFTVHGPGEFDAAEVLHLGAKVGAAEFVVAISQFGRSQMFRWCAAAQWPKVQVVHCGVNQRFAQGSALPIPEARRLVCVGRLCEQKGQVLLVEAAGVLAREGLEFELVLVGDGPMRGEIEAAVRRLGLEHHVRITGWASEAQVRQEVERSRALVLASFAEGLPVVLMEALALGRPVITSRIAGIPELVVDGLDGWLVTPSAVEELVAAMREALTLPVERLTAMGLAGRRRVLAEHDCRREAGKLVELFRRSQTKEGVR